MTQTSGALRPNKRQQKAHLEQQQELRAALGDTRVQINQAYAGFNHASDPDLVESYVFEINALQARYNYLVRRAKELEGTGAWGAQ